MIVKNEEVLLERALKSCAWANSIHILDTGSRDRTVEIARAYTENVYLDFVWTDSFCDAQNFLLSKIRHLGEESWIISLDADECVLSSEAEIREAISRAKDVVRVTMVAEGANNTFGFGRIFRNTPEIYWVASIHKHLNVPGEGEDVGDIRIMYGYSPAHELDIDRSLRMLEKAVADGEGLPRNLYYLGREYWYKHRYQEAIDTFKRYIPMAHWRAELADAYLIMAQVYEAMRMPEDCAMHCLQAILINSNFKEAIEYMARMSLPENKLQWQRMARTANNDGVLWKRVEAERVNDGIFLSPHNDDETLFSAFSLMREKPLVIIVTDSYVQYERGDVGCDAETRRQETINAMAIIGCPVVFLGIKDTELTEENLTERLYPFFAAGKVYAPAIQGGNAQHNLVGRVAKRIFKDRVQQYCSYTKTELYTTGKVEIVPTAEELELKNRMLACYKSQLALPSTRPHFLAVSGKSEWLTSPLRRVLITPWFGPLPEWFNKFSVPEGYSWILDTDIESFKARVKSKLGIDYPGRPGTGKVHDYRACLGFLYEEEIKDYDYWAHCDFDVVFGDVDKWFSDDKLNQVDIWSNHHSYICGPWTLYKNTERVRKLFMEYPEWREKLIYPEPNAWVEREFSWLVETCGLPYAYTFLQGDPYHPPFNLKKENGKLFQDEKEIPMFHFRYDKTKWPL